MIIAGVAVALSVGAIFYGGYIGDMLQNTNDGSKSEVGQIIATVDSSSSKQKFAGSVNFDVPQFAKFKGSESASVYLVEFGDYQCPFCKRFFDQTEPQMMSDYVDADKTRFYFLDVSIVGKDSLTLGQGSWCADEQGKYWEYHDYMYTNQGEENSGWGTPDKVKSMAKNISGLDAGKFDECLDSKRYEPRSQQLTQFASKVGLTGTPTMFVGDPEKGYTKITGAQPYSVYQQVIDAYLK